MRERVLLADDDPSARAVTSAHLEELGYAVTAVADGEQALKALSEDAFDVLVLDVMMPRIDGIEVCRRVRTESSIPIVMVTGRNDTTDVVVGLEMGADDYITKPYQPRELSARMRAAMRRSRQSLLAKQIQVGDLEIDVDAFRVKKSGMDLALTPVEFGLLLDLAKHAGKVCTRTMLLERVWGYDFPRDWRIVDTTIRRLREKIEDDPHRPTYIHTVRGIGYRLDPAEGMQKGA